MTKNRKVWLLVVLFFLVSMIPVCGFVLLLTWAFGSEKILPAWIAAATLLCTFLIYTLANFILNKAPKEKPPKNKDFKDLIFDNIIGALIASYVIYNVIDGLYHKNLKEPIPLVMLIIISLTWLVICIKNIIQYLYRLGNKNKP